MDTVTPVLHEKAKSEVLAPYSRVVVTGGLGFVGRHLVAALTDLGKQVTAVDVSPPESGGTLPTGVQFIQADLREPEQAARALEGAELVFHLAGNASGSVSIDDPRFDFETNTLGTFNLAEALLSSGVQRVVYLSSAMVYGRPRSVPIHEEHPTDPFLPYGSSKLGGEFVLRSLHQALGLPTVVGRAFTIYGPGEDPRRAGGEVSQFLRWHLNEEPIRAIGDADRKTRDFLHVKDLVTALIVIADKARDGDVVNLGSGQEVSLRQLARAIGVATGREPELLENNGTADDTYRFVADTSRLRDLGFEPARTLPDGLVDLAGRLGERPELPSAKSTLQKEPDAGEKKRPC